MPLPGRVTVRVESVRTATYGILHLPQQESGDQHIGVVVAANCNLFVEDGEQSSQPYLETGDIVIFGKFSGTRVRLNRDEYVVLKETDILSIVSGAEYTEPEEPSGKR